MTIGEYIRAAREARGIRQNWLAEQLGVSAVTLYRWETGTGNPPADAIAKVTRALGLTAEETVEMLQVEAS